MYSLSARIDDSLVIHFNHDGVAGQDQDPLFGALTRECESWPHSPKHRFSASLASLIIKRLGRNHMFSPTKRCHRLFFLRHPGVLVVTGIALNMFVLRVNAETVAKDPVTEVHWPAGYSPRTADIYSHNEVVIHASPSTVWRWLVATEQWPTWCSTAQNVKIITSEKVLGPHSKFRWTTVGVPLESTVAKYVPNERLEYHSDHTDNSGVHAYRAWLLTPVADGCKVISELVEYGPIAAYAGSTRQRLQSQLKQLKAVCESHPYVGASSPK
jgi:uncharacterized protein YndB with AHSA1/START domain